MLLASCLTSGNAVNNSCSLIEPILISEEDRLTNATARQILIHNETWEQLMSVVTVTPEANKHLSQGYYR